MRKKKKILVHSEKFWFKHKCLLSYGYECDEIELKKSLMTSFLFVVWIWYFALRHNMHVCILHSAYRWNLEHFTVRSLLLVKLFYRERLLHVQDIPWLTRRHNLRVHGKTTQKNRSNIIPLNPWAVATRFDLCSKDRHQAT